MKVYRAISKEEKRNLLNGEEIISKNYGYIHVLEEFPETRIVNEDENYKLSLKDFLEKKEVSSLNGLTLLKDIMIGVIPEDYYIEIEIKEEDIIYRDIGYYYWSEGKELAILETHIKSYNLSNAKIIN